MRQGRAAAAAARGAAQHECHGPGASVVSRVDVALISAEILGGKGPKLGRIGGDRAGGIYFSDGSD